MIINQGTYPLDKIKKAIKGSLGQIGVIARRLGVDRELVVDYLQKFPELLQALANEEEDKKDAIERAFLEKIKEGNVPCILLAIKTLCKDRGYSEDKLQTSQLSLFQTSNEYDLGSLSIEELEQLEKIRKKIDNDSP
jgi:hypothetical protein